MAISDAATAPDGRTALQVKFSYVTWTEERVQMVSEALGLTAAEIELLQGYLAGLGQKKIAQTRDRPVETIKAQSKSLLRKSSCAKMSDLVLLLNSMAYPVPSAAVNRAAHEEHNDDLMPRAKLTSDSRTVSWYCYGTRMDDRSCFYTLCPSGLSFRPPWQHGEDLKLQVIAPSRPAFGETSPAASRVGHKHIVARDALFVLEQERRKDVVLVGHQQGMGFAHPIAAALGSRAKACVAIGGVIPLDDVRHAKAMDLRSRIHSIGCCYALAVMEIWPSPIFLKCATGGAEYQRVYYEKHPDQQGEIECPEILPLIINAMNHTIANDTEAFISDLIAVCEDWSSEWPMWDVPILWLHWSKDPTIKPDAVA